MKYDAYNAEIERIKKILDEEERISAMRQKTKQSVETQYVTSVQLLRREIALIQNDIARIEDANQRLENAGVAIPEGNKGALDDLRRELQSYIDEYRRIGSELESGTRQIEMSVESLPAKIEKLRKKQEEFGEIATKLQEKLNTEKDEDTRIRIRQTIDEYHGRYVQLQNKLEEWLESAREPSSMISTAATTRQSSPTKKRTAKKEIIDDDIRILASMSPEEKEQLGESILVQISKKADGKETRLYHYFYGAQNYSDIYELLEAAEKQKAFDVDKGYYIQFKSVSPTVDPIIKKIIKEANSRKEQIYLARIKKLEFDRSLKMKLEQQAEMEKAKEIMPTPYDKESYNKYIKRLLIDPTTEEEANKIISKLYITERNPSGIYKTRADILEALRESPEDIGDIIIPITQYYVDSYKIIDIPYSKSLTSITISEPEYYDEDDLSKVIHEEGILRYPEINVRKLLMTKYDKKQPYEAKLQRHFKKFMTENNELYTVYTNLNYFNAYLDTELAKLYPQTAVEINKLSKGNEKKITDYRHMGNLGFATGQIDKILKDMKYDIKEGEYTTDIFNQQGSGLFDDPYARLRHYIDRWNY